MQMCMAQTALVFTALYYASSPVAALQDARQNIIMQQLFFDGCCIVCLQPDWDMFHSKHPAALLHATARVVSGSAIYVSDKPAAHDFQLLKRMVLPDGSVLRPLLPGRPTKDILFADVLKDNKTLLKVCVVSGPF